MSFFRRLRALFKRIFLKFDLWVRVPFFFMLQVKNWWHYFRRDTGSENIIYRLRNGLLLTVPAGTTDINAYTAIWIRHVYDSPAVKWKNARTIIDVGGHVGAFALYAAVRSPLATVYTFEPEPESFSFLQTNITQNNLRHRIICAQEGIGGKEGAATLHVLPGRGEGNSQFRSIQGSVDTEIRITRLQDVFDRHNIAHCDILKMNAEGVEYEIFYGLPAEYFKRISTIVMNYHLFVGHPDATLEKLRAHLEKHGFTVREQGRRIVVASKEGL